MGAIIRGRRNVVPGALVFSLLGYVGQHGYNMIDSARRQKALDVHDAPPFWERIAKSKWSFMKTLSDDQYANVLEDRMLEIDSELALIDEDIQSLKKAQKKDGDEGD